MPGVSASLANPLLRPIMHGWSWENGSRIADGIALLGVSVVFLRLFG
jgi:hypothetical protein